MADLDWTALHAVPSEMQNVAPRVTVRWCNGLLVLWDCRKDTSQPWVVSMLFSQQDPVLDLGWYRSMAQDVIDVFVDRTETRLYKWVARPVKTRPSMMRTVSRRSYELLH